MMVTIVMMSVSIILRRFLSCLSYLSRVPVMLLPSLHLGKLDWAWSSTISSSAHQFLGLVRDFPPVRARLREKGVSIEVQTVFGRRESQGGSCQGLMIHQCLCNLGDAKPYKLQCRTCPKSRARDPKPQPRTYHPAGAATDAWQSTSGHARRQPPGGRLLASFLIFEASGLGFRVLGSQKVQKVQGFALRLNWRQGLMGVRDHGWLMQSETVTEIHVLFLVFRRCCRGSRTYTKQFERLMFPSSVKSRPSKDDKLRPNPETLMLGNPNPPSPNPEA